MSSSAELSENELAGRTKSAERVREIRLEFASHKYK